MKNRQSLLARRPHGAIQDSNFNFVETDTPTPGEGEVLVRNLMRERKMQRSSVRAWRRNFSPRTPPSTAPLTSNAISRQPNHTACSAPRR
jgi:NADPH-dependent curcumin reductase CurA